MSKWLNGRSKGGSRPTSTLFATEEQAQGALSGLLKLYEQRGHAINEQVVGGDLRHEIQDSDGFVAVYWLSDSSENGL
jgi:hypothetical protein